MSGERKEGGIKKGVRNTGRRILEGLIPSGRCLSSFLFGA